MAFSIINHPFWWIASLCPTSADILLTIGLPADTSVPYTISGISSADIAGGKLNGNAVINSGGVATISVSLLNDSLTEGTETLTISAGGASASIEVMDTSTSKKTALENHNLSVLNLQIMNFLSIECQFNLLQSESLK